MRQITFAITTLFLSVSVAHAAPEDRGQRGPLFGVSAGALSGTAWDEDGREGGAHLGYAFALRLGEEALPNLSLGLSFLAGSRRATIVNTVLGSEAFSFTQAGAHLNAPTALFCLSERGSAVERCLR